MFKWTAFPLIRVAICLIAGIVLYDSFAYLWQFWWLALSILVLIIISLTFLKTHGLMKGGAQFVILVLLGGLIVKFDSELPEDHYYNFDHVDGFIARINSDNTERTNHQRYEVEIIGINNDTAFSGASGVLYLYIKKDSLNKIFQYGDVLAVSKGYFPMASPKNPSEFNYQQYLRKQHIYAHAFVKFQDVKWLDTAPKNPIVSMAYQARSFAKNQLNLHIEADRERAILHALLLGIKDYVDDDLQKVYASAGAMHVLAVSGLHVSIIYLLLSFAFKRWKGSLRGRIFFSLLEILIIWMYALITGFSPSVLRAVTMFSVVILSGAFSRKSNIYNTLGLAAVVLILYDPMMIYAVGFQLSFAAVFGIVILHPRLYRIFDFDNKFIDYLWSITCVSVAAQLATFPLTMLYFHQFPTYFLASNLFVIPAAFIILLLGILMFLVGGISSVLGAAIGAVMEWLTFEINELIEAIQFLPKPIFDWLYLDAVETVFVYLIMLFVILAFMRYSFYDLAVAGLFGLMFIFWGLMQYNEQIQQQKIVFYEIEGAVAVDLIHGQNARLLIDDLNSENQEVVSFQIDPNRMTLGLPKSKDSYELITQSSCSTHHEFFDLIRWKNLNICVLRSFGENELLNPIQADVVYFKYPDDFAQQPLNTDVIILGSDFNRFEIRKVKEYYKDQTRLVHSLGEDGFFEIDLSDRNKTASL